MNLLETLAIIFISNILIQTWRLIPKENRNWYEDWVVETIDNVIYWLKENKNE